MFDKIKGADSEALRGADESTVAAWCDELTSSDARVRAGAAFMLAMLPEHPKGLSARLVKAIKKEKNEHTRASALLALGVSEQRSNSVKREALLEKLSGCDSESRRTPPLSVRLAAIIALAWVRPIHASQEMIALLRDNASIKIDAGAMPWNAGDLGGLIKLVLPSLEQIDIDDALADLKALMKAHPRERKGGWAVEVDWAWRRLITRLCGARGQRRDDTLTLPELSDAQRRALRFGLKHRLGLSMVRGKGLDFIQPSWDWKRPTWRRFLGLDDPGPLDTELELAHKGKTRRYPIWKWFRLLAREKVSADALKGALTRTLSPAEIVELGRDATTMLYATYYEGDDDPSPRSTLLRDLIDGLAEEARAPDAQDIRFTLDKIGEMEMWKMEAKGWRGGPFKPKKKKARTKKKRAGR